MAQKLKALQEWCRRQCDGYRDVNVTNMTSSWKSGLAFCAIIHRYRPDLIFEGSFTNDWMLLLDYDKLKKEDVFINNKLAFDVARDKLGIPALLDAEDMVIMTVPDKLCIITYVAQYYNYFHDKPQNGGPNVRSSGVKRQSFSEQTPVLAEDVRPPDTKKIAQRVAVEDELQLPSAPSNEANASRRGGTLEDRCHICRNKVYLLERHISSTGHLYHRHCFRGFQRNSSYQKTSIYSKVPANKENITPSSSSRASPASSRASPAAASNDSYLKQPRSESPRQNGGSSYSPAILGNNSTSSVSTSSATSLPQTSSNFKGAPVNVVTSVSLFANRPTTGGPVSVEASSRNAVSDVSAVRATTTPSSTSGGLLKSLYVAPSYKPDISGANSSSDATASRQPTSSVREFPAGSSTAVVSSTTVTKPSTWLASGVLGGKSSASSVSPVVVQKNEPKYSSTAITTISSNGRSSSGPSFASNRSGLPSGSSAASGTALQISSAQKTGYSPSLVSVCDAGIVTNGHRTAATIDLKSSKVDTGSSGSSSSFSSVTSSAALPPSNMSSSGKPKWTTAVTSAADVVQVKSCSASLSVPAVTGICVFVTLPGNVSKPFGAAAAATATTSGVPLRSLLAGSSRTSTMDTSTAVTWSTPKTTLAANRGLEKPVSNNISTSAVANFNVDKSTVAATKTTMSSSVGPVSLATTSFGSTSKSQQSSVVSDLFQQLSEGRAKDREMSSPGGKATYSSTAAVTKTTFAATTTIAERQTLFVTSVSTSGVSRHSTASAATDRTSLPVQSLAAAGKTEWQLEAERRAAMRNGVYVDPEKQPQRSVPSNGAYGKSSAVITTLPAAVRSTVSTSTGGTSVEAFSIKLRPVPARMTESTGPRYPAPAGSDVGASTQSPSSRLSVQHKITDSSEPNLPINEILSRLEELDVQLQVLEADGRVLEQKIRSDSDDAMDEDKDSLMGRWFDLIKQRHELVREESHLMYRRRQQELEQLHEELEYQLRCLIEKPDEIKTPEDKRHEDELLKELVETVSLRNAIIDSIEVDRLRYLQEDQELENMMAESGLIAATSCTGKKKKRDKLKKKSDTFDEKSKSPSNEKVKQKKKLFSFKSSKNKKPKDTRGDNPSESTSDVV